MLSVLPVLENVHPIIRRMPLRRNPARIPYSMVQFAGTHQLPVLRPCCRRYALIYESPAHVVHAAASIYCPNFKPSFTHDTWRFGIQLFSMRREMA